MSHEYIQYRTADFISKVFPRIFAYWIGMRVADFFYQHDHRGRHAVMANLRHILEYKGMEPSEENLEAMTHQTFRNFGKYIVDFFRFTRMNRRQVSRIISIEHPEYITEAVGRGRGVLAVTAHFGSWEMAGLVISACGHEINVVALPQRDVRINKLFQSRREMRGFKVIPLGSAARGTLEALNRHELVALLADRDYSHRHNFATFFGKQARFPRGPAALCVKTGVPILPGFLIRQPGDEFLLRMHKPIEAGQGESFADVQNKICLTLEGEIGENPAQWYMFDEFWSGK